MRESDPGTILPGSGTRVPRLALWVGRGEGKKKKKREREIDKNNLE
jgi:hypothetical protein